MSKLLISFSLCLLSLLGKAQQDNGIYLLVRADDIGSSQAANQACIDAYQKGIVRSVELMVPCPWFMQAVDLLNQNPGLDVGVHLVLTSEWSSYKWRPLTCCPSLTDSNGYFYPMVWANNQFPKGANLQQSDWKLSEVEQEIRAQIEMAKKFVPNISHMGFHMGASEFSPEIIALEKRLATEYQIDISPSAYSVEGFRLWDGKLNSVEDRIKSAVKNINTLKPGYYIFVEHPGYNTPEMQAIMHQGYETVGADREAVTKVFTSPEVLKAIKDKGVRLISYADLKNMPTAK